MDLEPKNSFIFNFTWSIKNFSHYLGGKAARLRSPCFEVEFLGSSKFCLILNQDDVPRSCGIRLYRFEGTPGFFYHMMVRNSEGIFIKLSDQEMLTFWDNDNFVCSEKLDAYLHDDLLTIRCCILKQDTELPMTVWCQAHTEIKVTELLYTWRLDDIVDSKNVFESNLNRITEVPNTFTAIPSFNIRIFSKQTPDEVIYFAIESLMGSRTFNLLYNVALLDSNGRVAHSVQGQSLFIKLNTKQIVDFPFLSKPKLLLNKQLYLSNGGLTVHCKFSISTNDVKSCIQSIEYGITEDLHFKPFESWKRKRSTSPKLDLWERNKQKLCTDGKFSDFIIRSANQEFPVHKAILGAQSEVFCAMFEHDMKEKNTGVVEIADLDDDTISKLLAYVYTKKLNELDFSSAQKLYFAADRYRIAGLKVMCSECLKEGVDASNVCDIAVLADTHQDQNLKSHTQDYIFEHVSEVIDSDAWKKIMDTHPSLTSEIMQKMLRKQISKDIKP